MANMNASANLPIDVVAGTSPPVFRWRQAVHTMNGTAHQECEGMLPASCERAVETLVGIAKQALMDNAMLRGQVDAMNKRTTEPERIAKTPTTTTPTQTPSLPNRNRR